MVEKELDKENLSMYQQNKVVEHQNQNHHYLTLSSTINYVTKTLNFVYFNNKIRNTTQYLSTDNILRQMQHDSITNNVETHVAGTSTQIKKKMLELS